MPLPAKPSCRAAGALLPLICLVRTRVTSQRDVVQSHPRAWGYRMRVWLGAGGTQVWSWAEVTPLLGYSLGNARADPELTQISRFPLQLFPSDPWWAGRVLPSQVSEWEKNSNMFSRALKEFYFLHFLQATAVLICLSIHFLLLVHLLYI